MCVACIYVGGHAYVCEEARAECQIPFSKSLSLFLRQGPSMDWTLIILAKWPIEFLKSACLYVARLYPCTLNAGTTDVHGNASCLYVCTGGLSSDSHTYSEMSLRMYQSFLPVV